MPDIPLRADQKQKNKKPIYILIGVLLVVIVLTVYFGKAALSKQTAKEEPTKVEQKKKVEETTDSSKSGQKLRLVVTGFSKLYADPTEKTFRTDITQSEVDLLKKLINDLESKDLQKSLYEELDKIEVVSE